MYVQVFGIVNTSLLFCVIKKFIFNVWTIHLTWCRPQLGFKQNCGHNIFWVVLPCYVASINIKKTEKTKLLSSKRTGFKKIPNNFFLPALLKKPNSIFSSQIALNKAKRLQFGIKNSSCKSRYSIRVLVCRYFQRKKTAMP